MLQLGSQDHAVIQNRLTPIRCLCLEAALCQVDCQNMNVGHEPLLQWHDHGAAQASYDAGRRAHPPHQFTTTIYAILGHRQANTNRCLLRARPNHLARNGKDQTPDIQNEVLTLQQECRLVDQPRCTSGFIPSG